HPRPAAHDRPAWPHRENSLMPNVTALGQLALALALATNGACATAARHAPAVANTGGEGSCAAADSTKRSSAMDGQLVGEFRLTMVATNGARTSRSTMGTL